MVCRAQRVLWSAEQLSFSLLPAATAEFLGTRGLPIEVPGMTWRFGPQHSPPRSETLFQIGIDEPFRIFVDCADASVWEDDESGRYFINSSVELLDVFIEAIVFDSAGDARTWSTRVRQKLQSLDPRALKEDEKTIWPLIIDRFQLNIE